MMNKDIHNTNQTVFEQIKHTDKNGNEYWTARDLSNVIEIEDNTNLSGELACAGGSCEIN